MINSWAGSQFTPGNKLLIKNIVLPKPAGIADSVYVDEVVFLNGQTTGECGDGYCMLVEGDGSYGSWL